MNQMNVHVLHPERNYTNVNVYEPIKDWAGIGYKHWMVAIPDSCPPRSGVGRTLNQAYANLKEGK